MPVLQTMSTKACSYQRESQCSQTPRMFLWRLVDEHDIGTCSADEQTLVQGNQYGWTHLQEPVFILSWAFSPREWRAFTCERDVWLRTQVRNTPLHDSTVLADWRMPIYKDLSWATLGGLERLDCHRVHTCYLWHSSRQGREWLRYSCLISVSMVDRLSSMWCRPTERETDEHDAEAYKRPSVNVSSANQLAERC